MELDTLRSLVEETLAADAEIALQGSAIVAAVRGEEYVPEMPSVISEEEVFATFAYLFDALREFENSLGCGVSLAEATTDEPIRLYSPEIEREKERRKIYG